MNNKPMKCLPETYVEILQFLRDNPNGLTSNQLFAYSKGKRFTNFKTITSISSCVYYMRDKKLITTTETTRGKLHKISQHGRDSLAYTLGESDPSTESAADKNTGETANAFVAIADNIITGIQKTTEEETITSSSPPNDFLAEFDSLMQKLRNKIQEALVEPNIMPIQDKRLKLSVLEKLEPLYNDEISSVLAAIRNDLEQM